MEINDRIEDFIRWIGAALALALLAFAVWQGVWRGLQPPAGRTTGSARILLRRPLLLLASLLWLGLCALLWQPIPIIFGRFLHYVFLIAGILLYLVGSALYFWGARTLAGQYLPASAFGVQLQAGHRLITHGPYALVRHPIYLGLQIFAIGGLMIFQNWTFVFLTVSFIGLFLRARREEQTLSAEFGEEWDLYARQVPAWLPRLRLFE